MPAPPLLLSMCLSNITQYELSPTFSRVLVPQENAFLWPIFLHFIVQWNMLALNLTLSYVAYSPGGILSKQTQWICWHWLLYSQLCTVCKSGQFNHHEWRQRECILQCAPSKVRPGLKCHYNHNVDQQCWIYQIWSNRIKWAMFATPWTAICST